MKVKVKEFNIRFVENVIEVVIEYHKFLKVKKDAIDNIINDLKEDFWGLRSVEVIHNYNELRIWIEYSEEKLMEDYEAMKEEYKKEHPAPRPSIEVVGQIEQIERICKIYL